MTSPRSRPSWPPRWARLRHGWLQPDCALRAVASQRRLLLVLLFMFISVAALTISREQQIARFARVRTCADRFRQRLIFTDFVKDMRADEFVRYYRPLSRAAFDDVLAYASQNGF